VLDCGGDSVSGDDDTAGAPVEDGSAADAGGDDATVGNRSSLIMGTQADTQDTRVTGGEW